MRKHNPRRWLHAILDLLPVILIPVFMIYSHRHTLTEETQVDIQYKYQSNEVSSYDDLINGNIYYCEDLYLEDNGDDYYIEILSYDLVTYENTFVYEDFVFNPYSSNDNNYLKVVVENDGYTLIYFTNNDCYTYLSSDYLGCHFSKCVFIFNNTINDYLSQYNLIIEYTDFNIIESVEVQDTNDNIMSVFTKDLSNTVDNYFNMNQVFNLGDVWNWINTNLFSGTAPLIAKTIWNIIVYEFVVDLLFVFYGFFMFLIDFIDNLLDKPFNKGR